MKVHIVNEETGKVEFVIERVKYVREKDKKTFIVGTVAYPTKKIQALEFLSVKYRAILYM